MTSPIKRLELWDERLEQGEDAEQKVIDIFSRSRMWTIRPVNLGASRDFEIVRIGDTGHTELIELKDETRHRETGNICIEIRQGLDESFSGIMKSEATIWIHLLGDKAALYRRVFMVQELLQWKKNGFASPRVQPGTDNNNKSFILPISWFSHFDWFDFCDAVRIPRSVVLTKSTQGDRIHVF